MPVNEVVEAIERQDITRANEAAIAAWREAKHAVLADLVETIGSRHVAFTINGRSKDTYQRNWIATAEHTATQPSPMGFAALAEGLGKSIPTRDSKWGAPHRDVKRQRPFLDRIAALAECADDPRIATALVDFLTKAPLRVDDVAGVYGPAIELVVRIADERSAARMRALVDNPVAKTATIRDYFAKALPAAADAIDKKLRRRKPLSEADRAAALKLLERFDAKPTAVHVAAKPAADLDALIAGCLAAPADDGPRMVLADALLEREDPRGEFIQLQLRDARRELAEADRKRMQSLQRKHEKTWLGDITRVTKLRVWRRGFLDEAELLQGAAADKATWKRVAADPRLATLRTLYKGSASEELYTTFVASSATKQLAEIEVTSTAALAALARPLEYIAVHSGLTKEALVVLPQIAKQTGAKRLAFETKLEPEDQIAQLNAWPGTKCFDEIAATWSHRIAEAWMKDRNVWFRALDTLGVKRLGVGAGRDRTIVSRGKRGLVVEVHATQEWSLLQVPKLFDKVEKLVVRGVPAPWFKPGDKFAKMIAKLPTVELYDGWQPYA